MKPAGLAAAIAVTAAAVGLAGCGPPSEEEGATTTATKSSGAQVEVGRTINYGSVGTTHEIDCADGKSLNVGGSNNTLTVIGTCSSVHVGGDDNTITVDTIKDKLVIVGLHNTVTYKNGNPQIEQIGPDNTINRG